MPKMTGWWAAFAVLLAASCAGPKALLPPAPVEAVPADPSAAPAAEREFRAVWVATVANIDWPSRPGLSANDQQDELRSLLDRAVTLGLNGVIFQVRPMADAFYRSDLEPFSYYLTGQQGADPGYDPLSLAVEEAHRRGIELHAWFNPFRAGHPTSGAPAAWHVRQRHPDWVVKYGEQWWLDPGNREASEHSLQVIEDIVRRYDIDGIHYDDYFYPYPITDSSGREVPFPDTTSWRAAVNAGERRPIADWRRGHVDRFVQAVYERTKAIKPWVKVGISPFGIWRPGHPEGITGFDAYDRLYADARRWLHEGWMDYCTPQLYWAIDSPGQPYEPLLRWWAGENREGRHLWPGNYTSRVIPAGGSGFTPEEIADQVRVTRRVTNGNVHFSMRALVPGTGVDDALMRAGYDRPALVPKTEWLGGSAPGAPSVWYRALERGGVVELEPGNGDEPFVWHVRVLGDRGWTVLVVPAWRRVLTFDEPPRSVVLSAVNRLGQEGPSVRVDH